MWERLDLIKNTKLFRVLAMVNKSHPLIRLFNDNTQHKKAKQLTIFATICIDKVVAIL